MFLNGMLQVLRAGCPWRNMHKRYGKWNSVYVRFRRWAEQGIWDEMLVPLFDLGLTDNWRHMIDGTSVHGEMQAAASKGKSIRELLIDHVEALRAKSSPPVTIRAALMSSTDGRQGFGPSNRFPPIPVARHGYLEGRERV
ncbi:transposase [Labrys monachus]|uniref:Transposase n=2 Tax=Labrys monachus TaxID=217067 RepID=A0ABU0FCW2_9HYPH|nr:transposase [Labrys monachus]